MSCSQLISFLPSKLVSLCEFAGFTGNREFALNLLRQTVECAKEDACLPSVALFLTIYYTFNEFAMGLGEPDFEAVGVIRRAVNANYADCAMTCFLNGMFEQADGDLEEAMRHFDLALAYENNSQVEDACHHFKYWCCIFLCRFEQAAKEMALLRESNWSPAAFHFNEAAALTMDMDANHKPELEEEILRLLK